MKKYSFLYKFLSYLETSTDPELVGPILKAIVEKLPYPNKYLFLPFQIRLKIRLKIGNTNIDKNINILKKLFANFFRLLLQRLMKMCDAILRYTEFNLMTVQNLSIVLGPNLLYDRIEGEDDMVCKSIFFAVR